MKSSSPQAPYGVTTNYCDWKLNPCPLCRSLIEWTASVVDTVLCYPTPSSRRRNFSPSCWRCARSPLPPYCLYWRKLPHPRSAFFSDQPASGAWWMAVWWPGPSSHLGAALRGRPAPNPPTSQDSLCWGSTTGGLLPASSHAFPAPFHRHAS